MKTLHIISACSGSFRFKNVQITNGVPSISFHFLSLHAHFTNCGYYIELMDTHKQHLILADTRPKHQVNMGLLAHAINKNIARKASLNSMLDA